MDIFVKSSTDSQTGLPLFDFSIKQGKIQTLFGKAEVQQKAVVSAYLQKGTVPQLETTGTPWLEVVTGEKSLLEADAEARANIQEMAGTFALVPVYTTEKNKLVCTIQEA